MLPCARRARAPPRHSNTASAISPPTITGVEIAISTTSSRIDFPARTAVAVCLAGRGDDAPVALGPLAQQSLHALASLRLALVHGQRAVIPALLARRRDMRRRTKGCAPVWSDGCKILLAMSRASGT